MLLCSVAVLIKEYYHSYEFKESKTHFI